MRLCKRRFIGVSTAIAELLPFDWLNFNEFFPVLSHSYVTDRWNFMKLILNIYYHDVVMHVKFHEGVISYRGVIAL